jgi:uncharacterized protein (TIGR01244 family)
MPLEAFVSNEPISPRLRTLTSLPGDLRYDGRMRRPIALAAFLLAAPLYAQVPQAVDPAEIPAYKVIAPGIVAAGQPAAEVLPKLGAMGFKTVLNLRMPDEGGPANERDVVESQGLRYVSVPVGPGRFGLAEIQSVEKVIGDPAARPILFHCASSNRVGAAWAAVLARRGKPLDEALAAGREAGLKSSTLEDAVRRIVAESPSNP